ncbi:MAG: cytidine deaminase [Thermoleophilia bacterium]
MTEAKSRGRVPTPDERHLWQQAAAVAERAYAPYSQLQIGAAVQSDAGTVHLGVNVESAAYPAGMCAERVALGAAVTAGAAALRVVAVAATGDRDALPCGACLQALAEFGDPVVVGRAGGELCACKLSELLTTPFSL